MSNLCNIFFRQLRAAQKKGYRNNGFLSGIGEIGAIHRDYKYHDQ